MHVCTFLNMPSLKQRNRWSLHKIEDQSNGSNKYFEIKTSLNINKITERIKKKTTDP